MSNFKDKIKSNKEQLKTKYRSLKDKIDPKIGSKLYSTFKISLSVIFFLLIPILFTTLSTLAGNEKIAYQAYEAVQWTTFSFLLVFLFLFLFFKEYPRKLTMLETKEKPEKEVQDKKETQAIVLLEDANETEEVTKEK